MTEPAQNLGASLGTALIGSVLIIGLTSGVQNRLATDTTLPKDVREQLVEGTSGGVEIITSDEAAVKLADAGLSPDEVEEAVAIYEDSRLQGLRTALFLAAILALLALPVARRLPDRPLATGEAAAAP